MTIDITRAWPAISCKATVTATKPFAKLKTKKDFT